MIEPNCRSIVPSKNLWEIVNFNYFKILDFHIAENNVNKIKKKKKRGKIFMTTKR